MLQEYLDTKTFGERIKALRKQNNMTQEQLAETINQVVQIMEELSPELQKVALEQIKLLKK